jgi:hypothetical protein
MASWIMRRPEESMSVARLSLGMGETGTNGILKY